eukprot:TRINITY_DN240_c0_g1_i7.p1 TRINITY_DN240_c0_g1~~TRINITY_DN240_c0_g1_i7.p1  ORF type:complete len:1341 (+),score=400.37 TRINITY_DN240_c0_g1_i7:98-4024(+)
MPRAEGNEPYPSPDAAGPRLEALLEGAEGKVETGKEESLTKTTKADKAEKPADEKKGDEEEEPKVGALEIFRFADGTDKLLIGFGCLGATINGCAMPAFSFIFGKLVSQLADDPAEMSYWAIWMAAAGGIAFIAAALQMAAFTAAGERQADRIRSRYLAALLNQEPGWHDGQKVGTLSSRLHGDTHVIHAGVGEKIGVLVMNVAMVLGSYIIGFVASWRLTLIMLSTAPLVAAGGALMQWSLTTLSDQTREAYAEAGGIAEEVLASVRTVYAFNGQEASIERYSANLDTAKSAGMKRGFAQGAGIGFVTFIMFATYGLAFYYASWLIEWRLNDIADVLTCFFAVLMGSFALGGLATPMSAMAAARAAAWKVFRVIDRKPAVRSGSRRLPNLRGSIEMRGVCFRYPTRQEHWVFRDLDLSIAAGKAVALVGASGCGKSSVVNMLQRFYDPGEGLITVDGVPLAELDLEWWRAQIGIVTQEPVLFTGTIAENVRMGLGADDWSPGDEIPSDIMQRIEKACRDAQIHDIVTTRFPDGYHTRVGEGGSKLSGGQKQRVAIARAIVKDPRILLLDEATSALDRRHEADVQRALNAAMQDRTTVIVAHRLTTVRHAHNIIVLRPPPRLAPGERPTSDSCSRVAEQGTHDELMAKGGMYAQLCRRQLSAEKHEDPSSAAAASPSAGQSPSADRGEKEQDMELEDPDKEAEEEAPPAGPSAMKRVAGMTKPWMGWIILGLLGCLMLGVVYPIYAILFTKVITAFVGDPMSAREDALIWCILFPALGLLCFLGYVIEMGCFGVAGEKLTIRLRKDLFSHMLRQDLAFYDRPGHESGALSALLAAKAEVIYKVFGPAFGQMLRVLCTLIVGFGLAFYISWELTLVILVVVPVMAIAGFLQFQVFGGMGFEDSGKDGGEAGRLGSECLLNVRTVVAFNCQGFFQREFDRHIGARASRHQKKAVVSGVMFGFSQFVMFAAFALSLWYGGLMIDEDRMPEEDYFGLLHDSEFGGVMMCSMAVVISAMGVGETAAMQTSEVDADEAAKDVFAVLDTAPLIDQMCPNNSGARSEITSAALDFHGVDFAYPTRRKVPVLDSLDLHMAPGKSTALIGDTGCGKSTVMQLLLRFYEPGKGRITIDGIDTSSLNLRYLRDQIGLVSQEPVLFSGSIADNIRMGHPEATLEEVQEAAKRAHVHDFIEAMPDGYSTLVGQKGSQLSGGQKQRVAIARAVIKRPRVLLLDEATSALDSNSEREVQDALDAIVRDGGMTTVEIAHRLTTIENDDSIAVLSKGKVIEQGSHAELMRLDGDYASRYELYHSLE